MPETTVPDTLSYLLLGLGAVFVIMGGLIGSMYLRFRNLQKDIELINQISQGDPIEDSTQRHKDHKAARSV